jgi:hypothetical protein
MITPQSRLHINTARRKQTIPASGHKNPIQQSHNQILLVIAPSKSPTGVLNFHQGKLIDPIIKQISPMLIYITSAFFTTSPDKVKITTY